MELRCQGHAFVDLKHIWLLIFLLARKACLPGVDSVGRNHGLLAIGEIGAGEQLLCLLSNVLTLDTSCLLRL